MRGTFEYYYKYHYKFYGGEVEQCFVAEVAEGCVYVSSLDISISTGVP